MKTLLEKRNRFRVLVLVAAVAIAALVINNRPAVYEPVINPADFSADITNKYFSLSKGNSFVYSKKTADGTERVEIVVTGETKEIMGVKTLVYWDRVWLGKALIEDTHDYLAQHRDGTVWYFGEDVDNYEDGVLKDHDGAWTAGVDGAKPGIWMLADPKVGDAYRQEYYPGHAEDQARVEAIDETVVVSWGTLKGCVKTYDFTELDSESRENKYYCPTIHGMALEVDLTNNERLELVEVK